MLIQHLGLKFMELVLESLQSEADCSTDEDIICHFSYKDVFLAFVAIIFLKDSCLSSFKSEI